MLRRNWVAVAIVVTAGYSGTSPQEARVVFEGYPERRYVSTMDSVWLAPMSVEARFNNKVSIIVDEDGRYYWGTRAMRPLTRHESGDFTLYVATGPTGGYVKVLNAVFGEGVRAYMEHVSIGLEALTYYGLGSEPPPSK